MCAAEKWAPVVLGEWEQEHLAPYCDRNIAFGLRRFTLQQLVDRINDIPDEANEKGLLVHYWQRMCLACAKENEEATVAYLSLLALATHTTGVLIPKAKTGVKFLMGRKPNTGGPVRKRIAAELKKNPKLKPRQVWALIKTKHPKSWDVEGDTQIWVDGRPPMGYHQFSNVCAEERKKLQT